jgi:beta-N-acetylhexosaminidase
LRALEAGDDILLMPEDLPASIDAIRAAVESGEVTQARLDESVLRILRLKEKLGLFRNAMVDASAAPHRVGTPGQLATAARTASDSITLLRNASGTLPLAANSDKHVLVTGWGAGTTQTLADSIATHGVTTQRLYTGSNPSQATIDAAVAAARASDDVVVTTDNAWGDPGQQALVQALEAAGTPVVVVSLGGPYDLAYVPEAPTFLAAYGYQPPTLDALVADLFGAQPNGHLPVTVHSPDGSTVVAPYGTGLHY